MLKSVLFYLNKIEQFHDEQLINSSIENKFFYVICSFCLNIMLIKCSLHFKQTIQKALVGNMEFRRTELIRYNLYCMY